MLDRLSSLLCLLRVLAATLVLGLGCGGPPAPTPTPSPAPSPSPAPTPAPSPAPTPAPAPAPADGWLRLAPKGEGFAIDLPAEPLREVKPVAGPHGHTSELIQYTWSRDDLALIVSASPLVAQLVEHGNKALALDRTLASQIEQPGRTVRYQKVTDAGDVLGREAEVDLTIEGYPARLRVRLYMKGAIIFQVLALWQISEGQAAVPTDVERFFGSFALQDDTRAIAHPVDLWQVFFVPELGLAVELPKKPEVSTASTDTFLGQTDVTTMVAVTSFPVSMYSIEVASVPAEHADIDDAAILKLWKNARVAAYEGTTAPEILGDEASELLDTKGRVLILRDKLPNGQSRDGHLRAIVQRTGDKATKVLIASAWAIDPKDLPEITKRFYAGLKRAP